MKKNKFVFLVVLIGIVYGAFLFFMDMDTASGEAPEIKVPSSVLRVSVKDNDIVLLEGVSAHDKEDGNLTSEVFIENISPFDANQRRTVTYAVFDNDDHLSRMTRQIEYTDYQEPVIDLKNALCYYYVNSTDQYKDYVAASSVVDGDLSSQISVDRVIYEDNTCYVTYSVTDSCGTKVSLKLKADELKEEPNIEIILSDYLLRVGKGTTISPRDYIETVKSLGMKNNQLKSLVEIQDDYDPNQEGTYEFIYRIQRVNGDYGITKLVVIVE